MPSSEKNNFPGKTPAPDYTSTDETDTGLESADENELTEPARRRMDEGDLDSLNIYFRQMAENPLLSGEEEFYYTKLADIKTWGKLKSGHPLHKTNPLFPRIEVPKSK